MTLLDDIDRCRVRIRELDVFKDKDALERLCEFYRIDLTYTSNAMEGNSLTVYETKLLLERGLTVNGKPLTHLLETLGHGAAYNYMFSLATRPVVSLEDIFEMHKLFYILVEPARSGIVRKKRDPSNDPKYVSRKSQQPKEAMRELAVWMQENRENLHPVIFAARLHRRLLLISPYIRGNGQVARLAMNAVLLQNSYLPLAVLPEHRKEYAERLEASRDDENVFVDYLLQRVAETHDDFLNIWTVPLTDHQAAAPSAHPARLSSIGGAVSWYARSS